MVRPVHFQIVQKSSTFIRDLKIDFVKFKLIAEDGLPIWKPNHSPDRKGTLGENML